MLTLSLSISVYSQDEEAPSNATPPDETVDLNNGNLEPENTPPATTPTQDEDSSTIGSTASKNESGKSTENDPPDTAVNKRVTPNTAQIRVLDVRRFLKLNHRAHEITQFPINDTSTSGLYLPENTGSPQGGILILHDVEQHPHWPETVAPLREYLPDYGWNTLSIFLDNMLVKPLPKVPDPTNKDLVNTGSDNEEVKVIEEAPNASEEVQLADRDLNLDDPQDSNNTETVTTDDSAPTEVDDELSSIANALDEIPTLNSKPEKGEQSSSDHKSPEEQYLEEATLWVSSGMSHLNNMGQFNLVIIAHGFSANWAVSALLEKYVQTPNAKGYALILIDALPSDYPYFPLDAKLSTLDIPMLDIYTGQLDYEIRIATLRKNSMQRARRNQYLQLRFPKIRTNLTGKHNLLSRRVRGWLKSHAAGEEVQVKVK